MTPKQADSGPCRTDSTSYAWVGPTGRTIKLHGQTHVEFAWRKSNPDGEYEEDIYWEDGLELSDEMMREGWVRIANSFTLDFFKDHVTPKAMAATIDLLIDCVARGRKDPEKEVVWVTNGDGNEKPTVVEFIQKYGTRAHLDALFERLMAGRVASTYLSRRAGLNR